jgi:4-amino-4-deoxy-L-arabinose transferase-like glycosyltransferase
MFDRTPRRVLAGLLVALTVGAILRGVWLTADPPTHATVGIVWHDEGPWVHNARNKALWGEWRTDEWNPVFIAPVFTALEYGAFRAFGVGTWQARTVPLASGLLAIVLLAAGLAAVGGGRAALIGGSLLATNYIFVMWNRAALMESTMTAFIVASWALYALAQRRPVLGILAGCAAVLAWFSKASAAFFVLVLVFDSLTTLTLSRGLFGLRRLAIEAPSRASVRAAAWTLAGFAAAAIIVGLAFVLPHWSEYRFYNWQMTVTRKPSYALTALMDRASWLPIVHDFFTRMWLVTALAALAIATVVGRWRTARPGERLLVLWVLIGLVELVIHDSGNERRYIMFVPALVALSALVLGRAGPVGPPPEQLGRYARWFALPLVLLLAYLVLGSVARLAFLYEVRPGVHLSAGLAVTAGALITWRWRDVCGWLARQQVTGAAALLVTAMAAGGDLLQYGQWASRRTTLNYEASLAVGRLLPAGTLVHGKLANGLSLENRIRPIFVGRGFGNYADRTNRRDIRYLLTYVSPRIGYEGSVIVDVLDASPGWRIVATFDVAETPGGQDRAALIDKFPGG